MMFSKFTRYPAKEQEIIKGFFKELAKRTRKSGRISPSRQQNIMAEWEPYDIDVVMESISIYLKMDTTAAQNERYLKGIMRNKQKEASHGESGKNHRAEQKQIAGDEGARLQKYATGGKTLTCDF